MNPKLEELAHIIVTSADAPDIADTKRPDVLALARELGFTVHHGTGLDLPDLFIEDQNTGWIKVASHQSIRKDELQVARLLAAAWEHYVLPGLDEAYALRLRDLSDDDHRRSSYVARAMILPEDLFREVWNRELAEDSRLDITSRVAIHLDTMTFVVAARARDLDLSN